MNEIKIMEMSISVRQFKLNYFINKFRITVFFTTVFSVFEIVENGLNFRSSTISQFRERSLYVNQLYCQNKAAHTSNLIFFLTALSKLSKFDIILLLGFIKCDVL